MFLIIFFLFSFSNYIFTAEANSKDVLEQHVVTEDTNTASMGETNQIINFDNETVCVKFSSIEGKFYFSLYTLSKLNHIYIFYLCAIF